MVRGLTYMVSIHLVLLTATPRSTMARWQGTGHWAPAGRLVTGWLPVPFSTPASESLRVFCGRNLRASDGGTPRPQTPGSRGRTRTWYLLLVHSRASELLVLVLVTRPVLWVCRVFSPAYAAPAACALPSVAAGSPSHDAWAPPGQVEHRIQYTVRSGSVLVLKLLGIRGHVMVHDSRCTPRTGVAQALKVSQPTYLQLEELRRASAT